MATDFKQDLEASEEVISEFERTISKMENELREKDDLLLRTIKENEEIENDLLDEIRKEELVIEGLQKMIDPFPESLERHK